MAKDTRTIHNGIREGGKTFLPGQEDELEKALSKDQIARLTASGAISGFDAKADKAAAKETETLEPETEPAVTETPETDETEEKPKGKRR